MSPSTRATNFDPPACHSDGIGGYVQEMLYLTLANTVLWCIAVLLAYNMFTSALKAKYIYSARMRRVLVFYVVLMTIISTVSLALTIHYTHRILFFPSDGGLSAHRKLETLVGSSAFITLPFAVFGADALMIWRCWILYQGVHRLLRFTLFCILIFLVFVSLATAVWLFMPLTSVIILVTPITGATLITNSLLSVLIISRLISHERWTRKAMGAQERSSPFRNAIMICVESCALIIVFTLFALGVIWRDSDLHLLTLPLTSLPHICVISAFLIILRVANGRAPSTTTFNPATADDGSPNNNISVGPVGLPSLQFARPTSTMMQRTDEGNINSAGNAH